LIKGLEEGTSLQAITSEAGLGKTTVLQLLVDRLRGPEIILHRQPKLSSSESLKYLLSRLGVSKDTHSIEELRKGFIDSIEKKAKAGGPVIILIDEAQNLRKETLTLLHALAQDKATGTGHLRVIFAADEGSIPILKELGENDHGCRLYRLQPLSPEEIGPYIEHRLRVSGYRGPAIFTPGSVLMIAEYSAGIPRVINMLCSEALRLCTKSTDSTSIDELCIQQTIALQRRSQISEAARRFDTIASPRLHKGEAEPTVSSSVIEELERWFLQHEHSCMGTIGELVAEVQAQAGPALQDLEQADLLFDVLQENSSKLADRGIALSVRTIEGGLRVLRLQRTSLPPKVEAAEPEVAERLSSADGEQTRDVTAFKEGQSLPPQEPSADPITAGLAAKTAQLPENDTEIFRSVLLHSGGADKGSSRFFRNVVVLLIVAALAALAIFWIRKTLIGHTTWNRSPSPRTRVRAVTVSENPESTLLGLLRSAEMGNPKSQLALASLYQSGETVQKDESKAVHWLREAANHGENEAAYRLGNLYTTGEGVPINKVDGYCWYVIAAQAGHSQSEQRIKELTSQLSDADIAAVRYQLGQMSARGVGMKADSLTAYFWFYLADAAGHPGAKQAKQEVQSRMNQAQLATASQKAEKWLEAHPSRRTASGGQALANQR